MENIVLLKFLVLASFADEISNACVPYLFPASKVKNVSLVMGNGGCTERFLCVFIGSYAAWHSLFVRKKVGLWG